MFYFFNCKFVYLHENAFIINSTGWTIRSVQITHNSNPSFKVIVPGSQCHSLFFCRYGRHADAIFTNSYRKVLGQISARKFLQTVIGKRLQWVPAIPNIWAFNNAHENIFHSFFVLIRGENNSYVKRQSGVFEGTYKEDLTSIQTDEQYKAVHKHVLRHPTLP